MLYPKKVKHRKMQKNRSNPKKQRLEHRGCNISFGEFGLKAMSGSRVKSQQIESARRVMSRTLGKTGKIWIRIFPDRPYTKKPAEVGMGKGKGDPEGFEFQVLPGKMMFEVANAPEDICREALRKAGMKLPLKAKIISRV